MDSMSQRYTDDHSLNQDGQKVGNIAKETVEGSIKLLIEGIYFLMQQRQKQVKISYSSPEDLTQNTKDALAVGADDETLSAFMDKHKSVQMVKSQYPDNVDGFKQDVVQAAKQDLLVDQQKNVPEFKQALELFQQQKQAQQEKQSQGPSLGL